MDFDPKEVEASLSAQYPKEILRDAIFREVPSFPAIAGCRTLEDGRVLVVYSTYRMREMAEKGVALDLAAIGLHELTHWAMGHLWDLEQHKDKDKRKSLLATDCEVNSYIPKLQEDPWIWAGRYKLPDFQRWGWYYDNLPEEKEEDGEGKGCGISLTPEQEKELRKELEKAGFDLMPGTGAPPPTPTPSSIRRVERGLRAAIDRTIKRELGGRLDKESSWAVPHRFKEGAPGKRRGSEPKMIFAVDCSGSTSGEQVNKYYGLVRRLLKDYGARVLEFDDTVKYYGRGLSGKGWGGGTDFQAAQAKVEAERADIVLWFTDGEGEFREPKGRTKSIVVLTGGRAETNIKIGPIVRL